VRGAPVNDQQLQHYIQLSKHPDAAKRREAIIALGKSGDNRALKPLAAAYKTETDAALRDLINKAGRKLNQTTTAQASQQRNMPPQPIKRTVNDRDRRKAESLKNLAIDQSIKKEFSDMLETLSEALDLNPELAKDTIVIGLLAQATGQDGETAAKEIMRRNDEYRASGKKRKSKSSFDWSETINFITEIIIWTIVMGLVMSVLYFVGFSATDFDATTTQQQNATAAEINQQIEDFYDQYGAVFSIIFGMFYGAMVVFVSLFVSFIAWWIGVTFMNGEGLIYPFLTAMLRTTVFVSAFSFGTTGIMNIFGSDIFFTSPELYLLFTGTLLVAPTLIVAWRIGQAHNFGMAMGCANMSATYCACSMMPVLCTMLLTLGNV